MLPVGWKSPWKHDKASKNISEDKMCGIPVHIVLHKNDYVYFNIIS